MSSKRSGFRLKSARTESTRRPYLEPLEDRKLLAVYTVRNTADSGLNSLRAAIVLANDNPGTDTINFAIPSGGAGQVRTIQLGSALPAISDTLLIDGRSQDPTSSKPVIELDGSTAGAGVHGLRLTASNNRIEGLSIIGFKGSGIRITNSNSNSILSNYIGVSSNTSQSRPNGISGIYIAGGSNNVIGGVEITRSRGNVISGNSGDGVTIIGPNANGNRIRGNFIGTSSSGLSPQGNSGDGISISQASNTEIGGIEPGQFNAISGNGNNGITIADATSTGTTIVANYIGVDGNPSSLGGGGTLGGFVAVPNGGAGISNMGAARTTIGGLDTASRNIISGNRGAGIAFVNGDNGLIQGNIIGADNTGLNNLGNQGAGISLNGSSGTLIGGTEIGAANVLAWNGAALQAGGINIAAGRRNSILSNAIFSNTGPGISLFSSAGQPVPNDFQDRDTGPNDLQNYPVLTTVGTADRLTLIRGTFNSQPNTLFIIQFFSSPEADPTGAGEGRFLIGQTTVTTDGQGNATINETLNAPATIGHFVTATATDFLGNTSGFSLVRPVVRSNVSNLALTIAPKPSANLGSNFDYLVTVTNSGPDAATNLTFVMTTPVSLSFQGSDLVDVTSPVPGRIIATLPSIPAATLRTFRISVRPSVTGQVVSTATVTLNEIDPDPSNNTDTEVTRINVPVDLGVVMTADPTLVTVGDELAIVAVATNYPRPNVATGSATQSVMEITLPDGVTLVSAATGNQGGITTAGNTVTAQLGTIALSNSVAVRLLVRAPIVMPDPAIMTFSAVVRSAEIEVETDPGSDLHPNTVDINVPLVPSSDLGVIFTGNTSSVLRGQNVTFTYSVTNRGPSEATNVRFENVLHAGFTLADLSAPSPISDPNSNTRTISSQRVGDITTITGFFGVIASGATVTGTITVTATQAGAVSNTATVSRAEPDPTSSNDTATALTYVDPTEVSVRSTSPVGSVQAGEPLTYTLVVRNTGPATATNVTLVDTLPLGVIVLSRDTNQGSIESQTGVGGTINEGSRLVTATIGTLAPNAEAIVTIVVIPQRSARLINLVSVSRAEIDTDPTTDSLTILTDVSPVDLGLSSSATPGTGNVGDSITVITRVTNNGPYRATGIQLTSLVPAGFQVVSASSSQGSAANSGSSVIGAIGELATGASATVTIVGVPLTGGTFGFDSSISGRDQFDPKSANDISRASVSVANSAGVLDFASASFSAAEASGQAVVTITRSRGTLGVVTVNYATAGGSAVAGTHYTAVSGSVTFAAGETTRTIIVPLKSDGLVRGNLTVGLRLSSPGGGATLGSNATATLVILDSDRDVTGPMVVDVLNRGLGRSMTGVALVFNEALRADRATDPANYTLFASRRGGEVQVPIDAILYDVASRTVTITPFNRLAMNTFYRVVVNADTPTGVQDVSGNLARGDGANNGRDYSASFARGNSLLYSDRDGDAVTVKITNGLLDLCRDSTGEGMQLRILSNGRRSLLTGNVRRRSLTSDGVSSFQSIIGAGFGGRVDSRLTTPNFYVNDVTASLRLNTASPGIPSTGTASAKSLIASRSLLRGRGQ